MKVKLLMSFFISLGLQTYAQERFIEVTVTDTAWAKPDNFIYRITVNPEKDAIDDTLQYSDPNAYKQRIKNRQNQNKATFDSVAQLVKKSGFHILPPMLDEAFQYVGEDEYKFYSLDVFTGSADSLKILYALISKNAALIGTIEKTFAKNEIPYFRNLYGKLLSEARKKARVLAEFSGRKLGQVISVIQEGERKDKPLGGWTVYPPLSSLSNSVVPGWHTSIKSKDGFMISDDEIVTAYIINDTLVIRFALE